MRHEPAISLIIPAYNERDRLPKFLATARGYLDSQPERDYEVIVVDDGSDDDTISMLESLSADWPELAFVRHLTNLGKGAAVKTGMLAARGELRLFADADGAAPIEEVAVLRNAIDQGADIAAGSRLIIGECGSSRRSCLRTVLTRAFRALVRSAFDLPVTDTQCGFKLFRQQAAERLFGEVTESGFAFDLDLLALAHHYGYKIAEVPVVWREVSGSKVRLVRDSWRMLKSMLAIRRKMRHMQPFTGERPTPANDRPREVAVR